MVLSYFTKAYKLMMNYWMNSKSTNKYLNPLSLKILDPEMEQKFITHRRNIFENKFVTGLLLLGTAIDVIQMLIRYAFGNQDLIRIVQGAFTMLMLLIWFFFRSKSKVTFIFVVHVIYLIGICILYNLMIRDYLPQKMIV